MTPLDVIKQLLKSNPLVGNFILGGLGLIAAAAIAVSWHINVEYALLLGLGILALAFLVYLATTVVSHSPALGTAFAWGIFAIFLLWSGSVLAATVLQNESWMPPPYCIIKFWAPCAQQNQAVAKETSVSVPSRARQYKVYLQFAGKISRDEMRHLASLLHNQGHWDIEGGGRGGERTEAAVGYNEVRYRDDADAASAEALANQIQQVNVTGHQIVTDQNPVVKPGSLEIWISN